MAILFMPPVLSAGPDSADTFLLEPLRIGDTATYDVSVFMTFDLDGSPRELRREGRHQYYLAEITHGPDRTEQRLPALRLEHGYRLGEKNYTETEMRELTTRRVIQEGYVSVPDGANRTKVGTTHPYCDWDHGFTNLVVYLSGVDARAGADLSRFWVDWLQSCLEDPLLVSAEATAQAGTQTLFEGRLVRPISLRFALEEDRPWAFIRTEATVVAWFEEGTAWPVYAESMTWTYESTGKTSTSETRRKLAAFEAGGEKVAWRPGGDPFREEIPGLERSTESVRHPEDGEGLAFPYPLGRALENVHADPSLVRFSGWRAANPDYLLVGAKHQASYGLNGKLTHLWSLVFGTPAGAGFRVTTTLLGEAQTSYLAANQEVDPFSIPERLRFTLEDLPTGPITLGWALDRWSERFPYNAATRGPTDMDWGLSFLPAPEPAGRRMEHGQFAVISVGGQGPIARVPSVGSPETTEFGRTTLSIFLDNGHWYGTYEDVGVSDIRQTLVNNVARTVDPSVKPAAEQIGPSSGLNAPKWTVPAVAMAASLIVLLGVVAKTFLGVGGYAKIQKQQLLDLPNRERLLHHLQSQPGVGAADLQRATNLHWNTVSYHLELMEKNGLVTSVRDGRRRRYFPPGAIGRGTGVQAAVLCNESTRRLFDRVRKQPGVTRAELARSLGVSLPALYLHVERLEKAGLMSRRHDGTRLRFYPASS